MSSSSISRAMLHCPRSTVVMSVAKLTISQGFHVYKQITMSSISLVHGAGIIKGLMHSARSNLNVFFIEKAKNIKSKLKSRWYGKWRVLY